jgi:hypothetical protein
MREHQRIVNSIHTRTLMDEPGLGPPYLGRLQTVRIPVCDRRRQTARPACETRTTSPIRFAWVSSDVENRRRNVATSPCRGSQAETRGKPKPRCRSSWLPAAPPTFAGTTCLRGVSPPRCCSHRVTINVDRSPASNYCPADRSGETKSCRPPARQQTRRTEVR